MNRDARFQTEERLDFETREESLGKEIWLGVVLTAAIVGGFAWYEHGDWWSPLVARLLNQPLVTHATQKPAAGAPGDADAMPALPPHSVIPESARSLVPLPALADSDEAMRGSLSELFGRRLVGAYFDPERVIPKIVVTVDNLDRAAIGLKDRAISNVPGQLDVKRAGGGFVLTAANAQRYKPLVRALKSVDARSIVAIYAHYYPLFQQAYRDLGYPEGEFNDRLIQVIDHLMQAPDLKGPVYLTRPKVLYEFVDESLEDRSSGHKLLIRLGSDNEGIIKGKLNEIRHLLVQERGEPRTPPPKKSVTPAVQAAPAPQPAVMRAPVPAPPTPSALNEPAPEEAAAEAAAVEEAPANPQPADTAPQTQ